MGRPKAFDRDLAVRTVMEEMWTKGYEACSVKAISEKLGITRSSFYNTFGSREELFFEVIEVYLQDSPDTCLSDITAESNVLYELSQFFRVVCKTRANDSDARGCLAVNSISELVGKDDVIGPLIENAIQERIKRFEHLLKLAADNGELSSDNLHVKALALQNLLLGINVIAKVVRDEQALWASTKQTLMGLDLFSNEPLLVVS